MKKLLSLALLPIFATPLITLSCGETTKPPVEELPEDTRTWRERIETNPEITHTWVPTNDTSIQEAMDTMDKLIHIYFPKNLATLTPYEFAEHLLNIYNNNGSGIMNFTITYEGGSDTVKVDFKQLLSDLLVTFDEGDGITKNTPKADMSTPMKKLAVIDGMVSSQENADQISAILDKYASDLFLLDERVTLKDLSEIIMKGTPNAVIDSLFPILGALPHQTLATFSKLISVFETMSEGMKMSPTAQKWASDKGITEDFENLGNHLIRIIMTKATS